MVWLVSQSELNDHLVAKVGTLGNVFQIIPDAGSEPIIILVITDVFCHTTVPLGNCDSLQTALEKAELLLDAVLIINMVLVPMLELLFEVWDGLLECILC